MKGKKLLISVISVLVVLVIAFVLLLTIVSATEALRIIAAFVFVLFLPGFVFSYILFDGKKKFDIVERVVLAFAFSLVLVPLIIFYLNKAGVKITTVSTVVVVLVINGIVIGGYFLKKVLSGRK